ncbi:MAG: hypothetical protein J4478_03870 [Candidatus Diapherotrites archaeon]|uniref:DUF3267 domain-containing protein n=1 Tax=Candidatus Iainarchaeum sp. TaxID=3101447 RepID=A0A7J4JV78_9ARCH|nr:hypothetical protein [Candidatus Diapherotrites archaeon]HIH21683.1 hypothetical protein [Candidatus Diapherotrites archaeon]HIH32954.1 hypothetical protein [Candidatus Diapherotrites archaeon]
MSEEIVVYDRVNPIALFSIIIAGIALGAIAHEIVHVLLLSNPSSITFHIGDPQIIFSTCCLKPGEEAFESIALLVQFAVMLVWVFLNKETWLHEVRHVLKPGFAGKR